MIEISQYEPYFFPPITCIPRILPSKIREFYKERVVTFVEMLLVITMRNLSHDHQSPN
jgi:hypothetical protein